MSADDGLDCMPLDISTFIDSSLFHLTLPVQITPSSFRWCQDAILSMLADCRRWVLLVAAGILPGNLHKVWGHRWYQQKTLKGAGRKYRHWINGIVSIQS